MKEDSWKPEELEEFLNGIDRKTAMASDPNLGAQCKYLV